MKLLISINYKLTKTTMNIIKSLSYILLFCVFFTQGVQAMNTENKLLDEDWWQTATLEQVKKELKTANINARDEHGRSALHAAALFSQNPEIITTLITAGADIKAQDKSSRSVLHFAAYNKENPEIIIALIKAGADINAQNKSGHNALHIAAKYAKNPEIITALIKAGADTKAITKKGESAFDFIERNENLKGSEAYQKLYEAQATIRKNNLVDEDWWQTATLEQVKKELKTANINARTERSSTALHLAAQHSQNPEIITTLIKAGADIEALDERNNSVLHYAAGFNKNPEITTTLIKAGADVNALNKEGLTTLHIATIYNQTPKIITILIEAGVDIEAEHEDGRRAVHLAAKYTKNPEIITMLMEAGADMKVKARGKLSAFYIMNYNKHLAYSDVYWTLYDEDEQVENKEEKLLWIDWWKTASSEQVKKELKILNTRVLDQGDQSALRFALKYKQNPQIITALIKAGADVNARDKNEQSLLHYAAEYIQKPEIIIALIEAGADASARDENGQSALHYAAESNKNPEIITTLIKAGADVKAKDRYGKTALDLIKQNKHLKDSEAYQALRDAQ
jgi:ankyrin repeat protein